MMKLFLMALASCLISACQTGGLVSVSKRGVGGLNKAGQPFVHGRAPGIVKKPEVFVRNKTVSIVPKQTQNETGSLFQLDDQRNYLYASSAPLTVNQFIDVKVLPVSSKPTDTTVKKDEKAAAAEGSSDQFVKEMLEALPELDPGKGKEPKLINRLKMKIAYMYENGDALAVFNRSSAKSVSGKDVNVKARIPYSVLIAGNGINTNDLVDVHWRDSLDGTETERYSSGWQDEYSLRVSGFTEVKSSYARQLEDKRSQLESVKERLRNQLVSVGKERQKITTQRQKLMEERSKTDGKINELESTVNEQAEAIKEKDREIQDLRTPEDKPGDAKDGAGGA